MAKSYKDLEKEFKGMDSEYREYLGLLGLRHVVNETADALERRSIPRHVNPERFDPVGRYKNNVDNEQGDYSTDADTELGQDTIISLVDRMRNTTFKFKIMNAMETIVTPLRAELERISFEEQQLKLRMHTEDNLYQQATVEAIESMSKSVETNMIRGLVMEYQRFTRHPVWSSLRYLNAGLIKPVANGIKTILFGWKKEKSDTDRIVESVNELTEFMMTGQIDKTESFMDKYIRKGLLQSMGERILRAGNVDRDGAQRIEDLRATGQQWKIDQVLDKYKTSGANSLSKEERQLHRDIIASKVFSTIIKRGRLSNIMGNDRTEKDITPYDAEMKSIAHQSVIYLEHIAKANAYMLMQSTQDAVSLNEFFNDYDRVISNVMETVSVGQTDRLTSSISGVQIDFMKQHKEQMEQQELLLESNENIEKHTKDTAKRTRRGFGSLIAVIGVTLGGLLAKLGMGALGAMGVGGGLLASTKGVLKRLPLVSAGLGLLETRDSNQQIREELERNGANTTEIALSLINNTSRGLIGAILDSSTSLAASAADFVIGGDDAKRLQQSFSDGFISRLKNSPDFPLFGANWWGNIFDTLGSDDFWSFGDTLVGRFIKSLKGTATEIDNVQFNASSKAMENIDTMYDSMNDLFTPVHNGGKKKPKSGFFDSSHRVLSDINGEKNKNPSGFFDSSYRVLSEINHGIEQMNKDSGSLRETLNQVKTNIDKGMQESIAKPVEENGDGILDATKKAISDFFKKQKTDIDRQTEAAEQLTTVIDGLKKELNTLGKNIKETKQNTAAPVFDTDLLLNKIGV